MRNSGLGGHCVDDENVACNVQASPAPASPLKVNAETSVFQMHRLQSEECGQRFRLWCADLFFFPDYSELSELVFEPCWIPEHLLRDGGTVPVHAELAGLAEGFEPLRYSLRRGPPPRRVDATGLTVASAPADAVGVAWRPVFRVRYTYAWTPFEAFMAAGRAAIAVSIRRPYVYL